MFSLCAQINIEEHYICDGTSESLDLTSYIHVCFACRQQPIVYGERSNVDKSEVKYCEAVETLFRNYVCATRI